MSSVRRIFGKMLMHQRAPVRVVAASRGVHRIDLRACFVFLNNVAKERIGDTKVDDGT